MGASFEIHVITQYNIAHRLFISFCHSSQTSFIEGAFLLTCVWMCNTYVLPPLPVGWQMARGWMGMDGGGRGGRGACNLPPHSSSLCLSAVRWSILLNNWISSKSRGALSALLPKQREISLLDCMKDVVYSTKTHEDIFLAISWCMLSLFFLRAGCPQHWS